MTSTNDRTAGVYVKVNRAKEHVRDLETLVQRFLQTNPYTIVVQDEPDTGDRVFRVKVLRKPPLELAAIVGDAIHNLRAALDLLICELVRGEGEAVMDTTGFPVAKSAEAFKSGHLRKVKGAPKEAIDLIKRAKPYKGGNEPLWRLHRLDIADKHRILIAVGSVHENVIVDAGAMFREFKAATLGIDPSEIPSMPVAINPADKQWPLKDGAEIYRIRTTVRESHEDEDVQFTIGVAFGEGEVVQGELLVPTVHQLVDFVEGFIEPFLPLLRNDN